VVLTSRAPSRPWIRLVVAVSRQGRRAISAHSRRSTGGGRAASFAAPLDARRGVIEAALQAAAVQRLPDPTGANLVADFMGFYFTTVTRGIWPTAPASDDRCHSRRSDRPPSPLGGPRTRTNAAFTKQTS
jgi:hypothetical protein